MLTSVLLPSAEVAWSSLCVWTSRTLGMTTSQSKSAEMDRYVSILHVCVPLCGGSSSVLDMYVGMEMCGTVLLDSACKDVTVRTHMWLNTMGWQSMVKYIVIYMQVYMIQCT